MKTKRLILASVLSLGVVSFFACDKLKDLVPDIATKTEYSSTLDIPASPSATTVASTAVLNTSELESDQLKLSDLKCVQVDKIKFVLTEPAGGNLDAIDNASVSISANGKPSVVLASTTVGKGINTVEIAGPGSSNNLASYFQQPTVSFTYSLKTNGPNTAAKLAATISYVISNADCK